MDIDYKAVVEILENFLKKEKTEILGISVGEEYQLRQAVENLIQENKELKEKVNVLVQEKEYLNTIIDSDNDNYIPKSKIEDVINNSVSSYDCLRENLETLLYGEDCHR